MNMPSSLPSNSSARIAADVCPLFLANLRSSISIASTSALVIAARSIALGRERGAPLSVCQDLVNSLSDILPIPQALPITEIWFEARSFVELRPSELFSRLDGRGGLIFGDI